MSPTEVQSPPAARTDARLNGAPQGDAVDSTPAPLVSVVMTVYNTAPYLVEALDSVLNQTFTDYEFVIIDDGSTDRCPEILAEYAARHPRIRYVSRPHRGIVGAANEGIELARGRYVARMDSDDISVPHRLATQVEYMEAHPECVLLGSRVMLMDPYGSPVAESGHKLSHEEIDRELLTAEGGWALVHPSTMIRLDALRAVGGYRGWANTSEDHDLYLRLAEVGRVANLDEVLLWYRRHYKSVTHTQYNQQLAVKEGIIRDAYARRGKSMPAGWKFEGWSPPPLAQQLRLWGWAALKAKNRRVARLHAVGAVRRAPFSIDAWRLMYCALRGY